MTVLVEGWGESGIGRDKNGTRLLLENHRLPALEGLRVGGLWPSGKGLLLQLYRDPFATASTGAGPSSSGRPGLFIVAPQGLEAVSLLADGFSAPQGFELFALLPDPRAKTGWLAQYRNSDGPAVASLFFMLADLGNAQPLSMAKADFETALTPRPMTAAAPALMSALRALGPAAGAAALVRVADAAGRAAWYSYGADPSASRELQAWTDDKGSTLLLAPDGRGALVAADGAATRSFALQPPLAGAWFSGCSWLDLGPGVGLVLVAVWEEGDQTAPRSGILVERLVPPAAP